MDIQEKSFTDEICDNFGIERSSALPNKYDDALIGASHDHVLIYDVDELDKLGYDSNVDGDYDSVIFAKRCTSSELGDETIILSPDEEILNKAIVAAVNGLDKAIYDYDMLVDRFMEANGWSYEDAEEWISYNTIRAIPYMGHLSPIIMYNLEYMR